MVALSEFELERSLQYERVRGFEAHEMGETREKRSIGVAEQQHHHS